MTNPNKWVEEFIALYKDEDTYLEGLLAYLRCLIELIELRKNNETNTNQLGESNPITS